MALALILGILVVAFLGYEYMQNENSGGPGSGGPTSGNPFIDALANAIAKAEGANSTINNPGDLTAGDVPSEQVTGTFNNAGVVIIDSLENGWQALLNKLGNIMNGLSSVYSPDMTISQLAQTYTGGDNADGWAQTVASELGVTPDTTLSDAASQYGGDNGE